MKHYKFCEFEHERKAFQELEEKLGKHPGAELYPNFELFNDGKKVYLECDLILIGKSFCAVIELKHWIGHVKIQPNYWYRGNRPVDDPHRINNHKCKVLKSAISKQLPATKKLPYVQSIVVLTNPESEIEGDDRAKYLLEKGLDRGQITLNGISELAKYISKRLGRDGSTGKNILTEGDFKKLISYFDKCFDRPERDYADQIPGYHIIGEIEHTDRYVAYMAEKIPPIGKRKYRLRAFGKLSTNRDEQERQLRSLTILDSLEPHPNIRSVRSVPNEHDLIIEETEWGVGQTLEKKLIEVGSIHWRVAAKITLGIAQALSYIHDKPLVHRNLCSKTILLNRDNEPELCDFDVVFNPESSMTVFDDETANSMSRPYISPEVFEGNPDSKSDVYSLGILLCEMLTGKAPEFICPNSNSKECVDVDGLSELPADLPEELRQLLSHSVCCSRDDRYESSQIVLLLNELFKGDQRQPDKLSEDPIVGQEFNTYKLEKLLATGSTSEVFLADNSGHKDVLKIYKADYPKERCLEERDMLYRIASPNVPRFRTFIQWSGQRWCLVEEAVDGCSLHEEIRLEARPSFDLFKRAAIQLLSTLETMHPCGESLNANVIHNDINPSNILLSNTQDKVWLIDYGVASEPGPVSFRGTPGYIDKQLLDEGIFEACPRGDLYGLSVTLLEWLTGQRTIPVDMPILSAIEGISESVQQGLLKWFNKSLGVDEVYYSSASEMRDQFEAIFFQSDILNVTEEQEQEQEQVNVPVIQDTSIIKIAPSGRAVKQFTDRFVSYINSIHNYAANNKYALAEAQSVSEYFGELYEPFSVAETIHKRLNQDKEVVIILTGHAGDGKSALALDILKKLRDIPISQRLEVAPKDIEKVTSNDGKVISVVKDMSEQSAEERRSIIEKSIEKGSGSWLIVSNTGPLLKAFADYIDLSSSKEFSQIELEDKILGALNAPIISNKLDDTHELPGFSKPVILSNLTKVDNINIAVEFMKKMGNHSEWVRCEKCPAKSYCHINANVGLTRLSDSPIYERVSWLYQRLNEYDRRMTLRQMSAHLAFSLTGGQDCSQVRARAHLMNNDEDRLKELGRYLLSENFFGYHASKPEPKAENLYCIRMLKAQHFGSSASPVLDRSFNEGTAYDWLSLPKLYEPLFNLWARRGSDPKNANLRQSLRRLVYLVGSFHNKTKLIDRYIDDFIQSPMLRSVTEWRRSGKINISNLEKKELLRRILSVLLEEFSGFSANQYVNSHKILYLSSRRTDRQVFQSAQMISASYPFRDFELDFDAERQLPVLKYKKKNTPIFLVLSLPMLDYVIVRSHGGLVEGLDPIYLNQLDQFRAQLLTLSESSGQSDEISLLHVDVEGKVKVHRYELDENENVLESI